MTTPPWCREKVMVYYYMYLLCLNHVNENYNVSTETSHIFMSFA